MTKGEDVSICDRYHFRRKHSFYEGQKSRGVYELDKIEDSFGDRRRQSLSSLTLLKVKQVISIRYCVSCLVSFYVLIIFIFFCTLKI